jgi:hypothetical protein
MRNHFLRAGGIPSGTDTVTMVSGSPFTTSVGWGDSGDDVDGAFTFTLANVPTVPKAGKRVAIIHFCYRIVGTGNASAAPYLNYTNWFKPSNQSGSATFTLGGSTPTLLSSARTAFNAAAMYHLTADLNTSGSDSNVTFSWDNTSYSPAVADVGGYAVVVWIFDYVETMSIGQSDTDSDDDTPTSWTLGLAPGGSGSGWTKTFKAVTTVASNPATAISFTKGSGETDTTYTTAIDTDIGTNERVETNYAFLDTGSPTNMTGTSSVTFSSPNDDGIGVAASHVRFKPSSS